MGVAWDSVLKLAAFGVVVMIILQVAFYFIFQDLGYDSYLLGITLIVSILIVIIIIFVWRIFKNKLV
jgi:4-amino-4-deoxy-L-arabinose transferase-like glycosyltransferase